MDIALKSASKLAEALRSREIGARELLEHYLKRVDRFNGDLNAIVVRDFERARIRADEADSALSKGEPRGPLHGLPMTVKESFNVEGLPTTRGIPSLKNSLARRNALAIDRLEDAGAVIFGKTNVPLYLAEWQTFNEIYGTTSNPWDLGRTPSGSSGGAAAAIASGMSALEIGSDMAGSIRVPAHYCGIYGHRPTWDVCSHRGHELWENVAPMDLSTIGPLARSSSDLELAFNVLSGPDDIDAVGWKLDLPRTTKTKLSEYRVAVVYDNANAPVESAIKNEIHRLVEFLARQGATVAEACPDIDPAEAARTFLRLRRAAGTSGMSQERFDRALDVTRETTTESNPNIEFSRADTMYYRDWHVANEARHRMRGKWFEFFRDWDVLICPPLGTVATRHDHSERWQQRITVNGKEMYQVDQMFWVGYSGVAYLPATVAPLALSPEGLPIGVQIVAPQYGDYSSIKFASLLERDYRAFVPPPGYE